jgi:stage V sporulation protein R
MGSKYEKMPGGSDWTFEKLEKSAEIITNMGHDEFKLDTYDNVIEIISAEQMIDGYVSSGIPVSYSHWSYGKEFIRNMQNYKQGKSGLAYEIVINSDPTINYLMEENTMPMQQLVIAHAAMGHNSFFKNNYLFKQRTDASSVMDSFIFGRDYIKQQEEIHGTEVVEEFIDHCHSIKSYGVDHYVRPSKLSKAKRYEKAKQENIDKQAEVDHFWDTLIPKKKKEETEMKFPSEPTENLLYFFEKYSPNLPIWKREILRIVRKQEEYFYPQRFTSLTNEGWATFTHYNMIHKMDTEGLVSERFMLELLQSHCGVIMQPEYYQPYYSGINVYALGFAMFQDIKRICLNPTKEDYIWFPDFAGNKDWISVTQYAAYNHRDESFILQYLSPKVIRDFRLFAHFDDSSKKYAEIMDIHNDDGYRNIRTMFAEQKNILNIIPQIEIDNVDIMGDRKLTLRHTVKNGTRLNTSTIADTLNHVQKIWGFDVELCSYDGDFRVGKWEMKRK